MLPTLRKNSAYRIAQNKNYQFFIKGKVDNDASSGVDDEEWETLAKNKTIGEDDLQMQEAVNVLKDMIILNSQEKKEPVSEQTPPTVQAA